MGLCVCVGWVVCCPPHHVTLTLWSPQKLKKKVNVMKIHWWSSDHCHIGKEARSQLNIAAGRIARERPSCLSNLYCMHSVPLALPHAGPNPWVCSPADPRTFSEISPNTRRKLPPPSPKCSCKQFRPRTAAVMECWQLWITLDTLLSAAQREQWYYPAPCQI